MDSIYPSDTVHVLSGQDDDDVSTLSGCSSSPKEQSPGQTSKKFHSSPLRNKTKLEPYLNGKLPLQVSAALKQCNESKFAAKKGIPRDIDIATVSNHVDRNADDDGISQKAESWDKDHVDREHVKQEPCTTSGIVAAASGFMDKMQRCKSESALAEDTLQKGLYEIHACSGSHALKSPVSNNTRHQRLQRLRRLNLGGKVMGHKSHDFKSNTDSGTVVDEALVESKEDVSMTTKNTKNEEQITDIQGNGMVSSDKSQSGSKILDVLQDKLMKQSLVKKRSSLTPQSKQSLLDTQLPDEPVSDCSEDKDAPGSEHSLARLYKDNPCSFRYSTPGRIHRSFWSVVEPDTHRRSDGWSSNYRSKSSERPFPSPKKRLNADSSECEVDKEVEGMDAVDSVHVEHVSSSCTLVSGRSSSSKGSNKSSLSKASVGSPTQRSSVSTKSLDDLRLIPTSSPQQTTVSMEAYDDPTFSVKSSPQRTKSSIKALDDIYDGIVQQLQCDKSSQCVKACESIETINEPPALKRLMLAKDMCNTVSGYGFGSSAGSDFDSDASSSTSSIFSDLENANSTVGSDSSKSSDSQMYENAQYTSPVKKEMEDDEDKYYAHISIGIKSKLKPDLSNVIAELQKDLAKAGVAQDAVDIRLISPFCEREMDGRNSAPLTPADDTVLTKSTVSEDCSVITESYSRHTRKVSGSTIETFGIFAADDGKKQNLGGTENVRKLRRSILSTPSSKILKKIRKATDVVLRRSQQRRRSIKLGDEQHLLSTEDSSDGRREHDDISQLQDDWWRSTDTSFSSPRHYDQRHYMKILH